MTRSTRRASPSLDRRWSTPGERAEDAAWQARLRRITGLATAFGSGAPDELMAARAVAKLFDGDWRVTSLDSVALPSRRAPAISFDVSGQGTFDLGAIAGFMDCRFSGPARVEFSWQGDMQDDAACGRGWASVAEDGVTLTGHLLIHMGDEMRFDAKRKPAKSKAKPPRG